MTGVSASAITTGILDINNILIHVGQNMVNYLASTAAWLVLGYLNQDTEAKGGLSSWGGLLSWGGLSSWISGLDYSFLLRNAADAVDIIQATYQEL